MAVQTLGSRFNMGLKHRKRSFGFMYRSNLLVVVTLALCSLVSGCSSWTQGKDSKKKKDGPFSAFQFWKKEYQQPQKMAVLWSQDVLTMPGKAPTRGFGGRIYFYNERSQAIPVEGELIVYGYDETVRQSRGEAPQPDKTFKFTEEQFTSHFSESDLGASYSVWIPWDAADGLQKEITLMPTFRTSKGEIVQGNASKVVLLGRKPQFETNMPPIQTVSFEEQSIPTVAGNIQNAQPRMDVTTIPLPGARPQSASAQDRGTPNLNASDLIALEQAKSKAIAEAMAAQNTAFGNSVQSSQATAAQNLGRRNVGPKEGFINVTRPSFQQGSVPSATLTPRQQSGALISQSAPAPGLGSGSGLATGAGMSSVSSQNGNTTASEVGLPPGVELTPRSKWPTAASTTW